mmetsp:Transcript_35304/g.69249  ORF Transcript_35304/g.69249 Transcript_35304/m.69249 type:complete len:359 (-) Transcript_35304:84-1160(-)
MFSPGANMSWYADSYIRDATYGITLAPEFYKENEVRRFVEVFLKTAEKDASHCNNLRIAEAILPSGQIAYACDDNNNFLLKLAAFTSTHWNSSSSRAWLCSYEPMLASVYSWNFKLLHSHPTKALMNIEDCGYGFTDCIYKSGADLFNSILFVEAAQNMAAALENAHCDRLTIPLSNYTQEAAAVGKAISKVLFDSDIGLFLATDGGDNKPDLWGSAFAVVHGVASSAQSESVTRFFVKEHTDAIFQAGQVRHLPYPMLWDSVAVVNRTFNSNKPGNMQNGGYWALPAAWVVPFVKATNPSLAAALVSDAIADFKANGINEWMNKIQPDPAGQKGASDYVASAVAVYHAALQVTGRYS